MINLSGSNIKNKGGRIEKMRKPEEIRQLIQELSDYRHSKLLNSFGPEYIRREVAQKIIYILRWVLEDSSVNINLRRERE